MDSISTQKFSYERLGGSSAFLLQVWFIIQDLLIGVGGLEIWNSKQNDSLKYLFNL